MAVSRGMGRLGFGELAGERMNIALLTNSQEDEHSCFADNTHRDILLNANITEVNNSGYIRQVYVNADLAALPAPDNTNNRRAFPLPNRTWNSVAAGVAWHKAILGYDPDTTSGVDSAIIAVCAYDFAATPDGNNITIQYSADGAYRNP